MSDRNWRTVTLAKSVSVYQPAVKIRAVLIFIDFETGEPSFQELPFVGMQVSICEKWSKVFVEGISAASRFKGYSTGEGLAKDGYQLECDEPIVHNVLVWDDEYGVVSVDDELMKGYDSEIICGPETLPESWWNEAKKEVVGNLVESIAAKKNKAGTPC